MKMSIDEAIRELLDVNVEVPSVEARKVLYFLFETEKGKDAFDEWAENNANECFDVSAIDFSEMYSHIERHLIKERNSVFSKLIISFKKIAAVLIIPLLISSAVIIYRYSVHIGKLSGQLASIENFDEKNILPLNLKYISPAGARLKIVLPDSTKVCLNGNSKLSISPTFGRQDRRVKLEGEAYFDVAKDSSKRFTVNASDVNVIALGTSFYVQAYPSENKVEAVLLSGKVAVETPENRIKGESVMLTPNQKFVYIKSRGESKLNTNVETKKYKVWTDGELIFDNEPISEMLVRLEHFYNVKIVVKDREIYSYSFTASLENCSVEQIMEYLKLSSPVDYKIDKNIITLTLTR